MIIICKLQFILYLCIEIYTTTNYFIYSQKHFLMKKLFTLVCALMGLTGVANAATVNDLALCKHSYVLVLDDITNNGTGAAIKRDVLFGDGFFLKVGDGKNATNKKSIDLSDETYADGRYYTNYGEYGKHLNSFRLKTGQDAVAVKLSAKSKIIILGEAHASRTPVVSKTAPTSSNFASESLIAASLNEVSANGSWECVVPDDGTYWIGSTGDYFISFLFIEANEPAGTPTVKVGDQKFEDGLWYREVTCKANKMELYGQTVPTLVTYTTDGTTPTAASPVYTDPIKCYKDMTVKFQAYANAGNNVADENFKAPGAENEAFVTFKFNAPTISAEGANVTITSEYEGAKLFNEQIKTFNDTVSYAEGATFTLSESATINAYGEIKNGEYTTFKTQSASKDVYVLNPIKEKKTITVTGGEKVLDEEATKTSTTGDVYIVKNFTISADKQDFFVKNLEGGVVLQNEYKVPDGQDIYIKMSTTNITFDVAEGDSVDVKVICSKNSCKDINDTTATNRSCYINVDGKNYGGKDLTDETITDANIVTFGLTGGTHTFQKYSGTGNILISSIEITPVEGGANAIREFKANSEKSAVMFNLAGQRVSAAKGLVIMNGKKVVLK